MVHIISGVTILKNNAQSTGLFSWGWNKLKSATSSSYSYVKSFFVSEEKTHLHLAAGFSLAATTAYYSFPTSAKNKSRNFKLSLIGINILLFALSGIKTIFALGRNYGRSEFKSFYENKLLELSNQHRASEARAARLEAENQNLTSETETYRTTIATLEERDKQRSTESDRLRKHMRQTTATTTAFPVTLKKPEAAATSSLQTPVKKEEETRSPDQKDEYSISPKL